MRVKITPGRIVLILVVKYNYSSDLYQILLLQNAKEWPVQAGWQGQTGQECVLHTGALVAPAHLARTPQVPSKYLRKYVIKKPNQMAVYLF